MALDIKKVADLCPRSCVKTFFKSQFTWSNFEPNRAKHDLSVLSVQFGILLVRQ